MISTSIAIRIGRSIGVQLGAGLDMSEILSMDFEGAENYLTIVFEGTEYYIQI